MAIVRAAHRRALLAAALLLAVPVAALTHESFRPFTWGIAFQGDRHTETFLLPEREPLFLEYELVVHDDAGVRPNVVVTLNDAPVAVLQPSMAFATERGRVLLPVAPLRAGENRVVMALDPAAGATVDLRARFHNYYGIAPDFPRAAVVANESVAHLVAQRTPAGRAGRFLAVYLACLGLLCLLSRVHPPARRGSVALLAVPSLLPWAAFAYSMATPRYVWLSVSAVAVVTLVPWAMARAGLWMAGRPAAVGQAVAVAAVSLLAVEGALRLFNYARPTFVFYSDSYNRYRGQPGAPHYDTTFNSRGFNDIERQTSRIANVRRVVAIGDSFAVGVVPRRSNYLTLLERTLGADGPLEVVNLGVSGTGPRDYLALLVDEGLAMTPDLVLVGFYIGNDFEVPGRRLSEYSFVVTLGRTLWRLRTARPAAAPSEPSGVTYDDHAPTLPRERFLEIHVDRAGLYDRADTALTDRVTRALGPLRQMRDLSMRAGAGMVVALIPDEIQVDPTLRAQVARALGRAPGDFDPLRPTRAIAEALRQADIPHVDLLPAFLDAAAAAPLYKPQDTHWNIAGNRLAAEVLAPVVRGALARRATPGPSR